MPEHEKQAAVLHAGGTLMAVHIDGRLGALRGLIAKTPIDIIESFQREPADADRSSGERQAPPRA